MKKVKFNKVDEVEFSEIDFDLYNEIFEKEKVDEMYDNGEYPGDNLDLSETENYPIHIDKVIAQLQKMKENGAEYVEIDYHCDHIGYIIKSYNTK